MKNMLMGIIFLFLTANSHAVSCFGTEPFWGANVTEEAIALMLNGERMVYNVRSVTAPFGMPNTSNGFVRIYSDERGPVATVIAQKCNDGMSDVEYPKEVVIYTSHGALYGCCDK